MIDHTSETLKGQAITSGTDMKEGEFYLEGNFRLIEQFYQRELKSESVRFLYVGDHYMSDVHFSAQNKGWDALAVVEELAEFDK